MSENTANIVSFWGAMIMATLTDGFVAGVFITLAVVNVWTVIVRETK